MLFGKKRRGRVTWYLELLFDLQSRSDEVMREAGANRVEQTEAHEHSRLPQVGFDPRLGPLKRCHLAACSGHERRVALIPHRVISLGCRRERRRLAICRNPSLLQRRERPLVAGITDRRLLGYLGYVGCCDGHHDGHHASRSTLVAESHQKRLCRH